MAGTYDGLGQPLHGGYTCYDQTGTTAYLTVNDTGTHDFTFAEDGADNYMSIAITDTTARSSGYMQAYYASVSSTGGYTGGQINPFAADLSLGGTVSVEVSGVYIYVAESGTCTFSTNSTILAGYTVFFASVGSQTAYRAGFHCYSQEPTATNAANLDAGLLVECAGSTGTWGALLGVMGVVQPEYFLHASNTPGTSRWFTAYSPSDAATRALRINIFGTVYNIPCVADSCT